MESKLDYLNSDLILVGTLWVFRLMNQTQLPQFYGFEIDLGHALVENGGILVRFLKILLTGHPYCLLEMRSSKQICVTKRQESNRNGNRWHETLREPGLHKYKNGNSTLGKSSHRNLRCSASWLQDLVTSHWGCSKASSIPLPTFLKHCYFMTGTSDGQWRGAPFCPGCWLLSFELGSRSIPP